MSAPAQQVSASTANFVQVPRGVSASYDGLDLPSTDEGRAAENSLAPRKLERLPDDILLEIFRSLHALFFHLLGWDDPAGEQVEGSRFIPPLKYITLSRRIYTLARPIWLSRLSTWRFSAPNGSLSMRHNERIWSRVDEFADQVRSLYSIVRLETSIEEISLLLRFVHITHLELELHVNQFIPAFARYLQYFRQLVSLEIMYGADYRTVTDEAPFEIDSQLPKLRSLSLSGEELLRLFLTRPCTILQALTCEIDIRQSPLRIPWSSLKRLKLTGIPGPASEPLFKQSLLELALKSSNEPTWPLAHLCLINQASRPYRSPGASEVVAEAYRDVLSLLSSRSALSSLEMDDTWRDMLKLAAPAFLAHFWSDVLKFLVYCPEVKTLTIEDFRMSIVGDSLFPTKQPRRRGRFDEYFVETPVFLVKLASTKILRFTLVAEERRWPWTKVRHDWWRASAEEKFVRAA
ncbi:hypothetical protein NBRC10512v2_005875 [Rhodotorula toruloides]|uniref:Proteophosphoglycan ppg4 n=1 Tax=Rhodotorula toruloides (strain NP11) TaxID=1130832 RepID=M7WWZ9_RHOT1|nr:uncharacterized protein RHTO_07974 [Rhodotorula toruloides NP11]EMS22621.1 hypothetical protein RHTO_07974 [Rhodotorula toruloides NP11]